MGCLKATVALSSEQLKVSIGLVCMPNTDVYLRVAPTEIEIPVDGSPVTIYVKTNADYKIT